MTNDERIANYLRQNGFNPGRASLADDGLTGRQRRRVRHKQQQGGGRSAAMRTARLERTARRASWRRYLQGRA